MPAISTAGSGQMASIVETIEFPNLLTQVPQYGVFSLSEFTRASQLAPYFQYYKAAKVVWSYTPLYNTFNDISGATGISKPYMYVTMNRTQEGTTNGWGLPQIQATGARPQTLVGKKEFSYVPNWCSPGVIAVTIQAYPNGTQVQGMQKQFGWINTPRLAPALGVNTAGGTSVVSLDPTTPNPSVGAENISAVAVYNGHLVYVDQLHTDGPLAPVARVTCQVTWLFKGARMNQAYGSSTQSLSPLKVQNEPLVASA